MELLKRISGYTLVSVITGAISFLLLPILTTYLTLEDYGVLSIFNSSIRFLSALISLGMNYLLMIYVVQKSKSFPFYFKAFIKITVITALSISIFFIFLSLFFPELFGVPSYYLISIPIIALLVLYFETFTSLYIYQRKFKEYVWFTLGKFFIEIIFVILLVVLLPFNWKGRMFALIISLVIILFFQIKNFAQNKLINMKLNIRFHALHLIKKGTPLIFLNLSIMVMTLSDRFFIEHYKGVTETGLYGISCTVSGILLMFIGAIINVVRPVIYEKLDNVNGDKNYLTTLTIKFILGIFTVSILLALATKYIFLFMINPTYHQAIPYTYPLIAGLFFWGIYNYFVSFLMYHKDNLSIGAVSILGIVINLGLNYILIIKFGGMGAAYATLFTYVFICIATFLTLYISSKRG